MGRVKLGVLATAFSGALVTVAVHGATLESPAYVLLEAPKDVSFREWRAEVSRAGIELRHAFPPAGGIAVIDDPAFLPLVANGVPTGTGIYLDSPAGADAALLLATPEGRALWHAHRALSGLEVIPVDPHAPPGLPLDHDALVPPESRAPLGKCSDSTLYRSTSEYMLGSVTVTLILPESIGAASTEDWTSTLETNVYNEVVQGLNELSDYYSGVGLLRPTWTYHSIYGRTDSRAQVTMEPISNPGPDLGNPLWLTPIYIALGYPNSTYPSITDKATVFNGDQRAADGTDWSFTIFVANSVNDGDGLFSNGSFGYAYLGGPFEVMTYDNDGWGIGNMNMVARHESSHIFYALDEYSSSGCTCTETSGYVNYQNQNCHNSCPSDVNCIMNEANRQSGVCPYTRGMIGWGDADSDMVPDPVDIAPETSLTAFTPDPTPGPTLTYHGSASILARTNQNRWWYQCDRNILTIANVQWRVDGGSWQSASPDDGGFNGASENYTFTTGALSGGVHTIEARAVDEAGQVDGTPASDTVTITGSAGITVTPTSGLITTEAGGTATFTIVLTSQPTANVTIGLSSSDTTEGTVGPSSVTFTSANWNSSQTVTVTGVDDLLVDGDIQFLAVTAPAVSGDANYNGLNGADVAVTNLDNDTAGLAPASLAADAHSGTGVVANLDGVLEPGETVAVEPAWKNVGPGTVSLTATASGLGGPAGATYSLIDGTASYGTLAAGATASCYEAGSNCFVMGVSAPATRPAFHWDATFLETLSTGATQTWTLHIGNSFLDAGQTNWAYGFIETILHHGVTTGCDPGARLYCPNGTVTRDQMAAFLARALAGADAAVPTSGVVSGKGSYDCKAGGVSLFSDVAPTFWACRHIHYIYAASLTTGCNPAASLYCPVDPVIRGTMAVFIARALAGSEASVPLAYTDPSTSRSYSCDPASPNIHFTDVPASDWYCKHVHYLWATAVIDGCNPAARLYCPVPNVLRTEMAKFLTNGFRLTLYGP